VKVKVKVKVKVAIAVRIECVIMSKLNHSFDCLPRLRKRNTLKPANILVKSNKIWISSA
jgi:hypothetical protein